MKILTKKFTLLGNLLLKDTQQVTKEFVPSVGGIKIFHYNIHIERRSAHLFEM